MKKIKIVTCCLLLIAASAFTYGCGGSDEPDNIQSQNEIEDKDIPGKDISKFDVSLSDTVNNDKTGKWRLSRTSDDFDIEKYAVSYYYKYFIKDDEIHFLVNYNRNTVTVITCQSDYLSVTIHEYSEGEENDASSLAGGMVLGQYQVNISDASIEQIE